MKKYMILIFILSVSAGTYSQGLINTERSNDFITKDISFPFTEEAGYPVPRFALSANPLGFLQFGPVLNAEAGLTKNLVLNTHIRFAPVGLLSYAVTEWPDKYKGLGYGGGAIYFFGEKRNKPYAGVLGEFQRNKLKWDEGESYEERETDNVFVFLLNGGYRFTFSSGFFINTGAFLGLGYCVWDWESENILQEGNNIRPAGLVEVTFGFGF